MSMPVSKNVNVAFLVQYGPTDAVSVYATDSDTVNLDPERMVRTVSPPPTT